MASRELIESFKETLRNKERSKEELVRMVCTLSKSTSPLDQAAMMAAYEVFNEE